MPAVYTEKFWSSRVNIIDISDIIRNLLGQIILQKQHFLMIPILTHQQVFLIVFSCRITNCRVIAKKVQKIISLPEKILSPHFSESRIDSRKNQSALSKCLFQNKSHFHYFNFLIILYPKINLNKYRLKTISI